MGTLAMEGADNGLDGGILEAGDYPYTIRVFTPLGNKNPGSMRVDERQVLADLIE
jgi:hypothetical protein